MVNSARSIGRTRGPGRADAPLAPEAIALRLEHRLKLLRPLTYRPPQRGAAGHAQPQGFSRARSGDSDSFDEATTRFVTGPAKGRFKVITSLRETAEEAEPYSLNALQLSGSVYAANVGPSSLNSAHRFTGHGRIVTGVGVGAATLLERIFRFSVDVRLTSAALARKAGLQEALESVTTVLQQRVRRSAVIRRPWAPDFRSSGYALVVFRNVFARIHAFTGPVIEKARTRQKRFAFCQDLHRDHTLTPIGTLRSDDLSRIAD